MSKNSRVQDERKCVHRLCKVLQSHKQVLAVSEDLRPGCSSLLCQKWDKITSSNSLRLQPQIDLLIEDYCWKYLCGVEVKYFKKSEDCARFNWSFYAGIDEAVAMLHYGFHTAALWHVFTPDALDDLVRFGTPTWKIIDNLGLPIEYTMMIDRGNDFDIINRTVNWNPAYLCKLSKIPISYARFNPIFDADHPTQLREMLYDWVLKQHKRRWRNPQYSDLALILAHKPAI